MENNRKIWKYLGKAAAFAAVCLICWYFRSILVYITVAAVMSLVGRPIMHFLRGLNFGRFKVPVWLATILTLCLIFGLFFSLMLLLSPLAGKIAAQVNTMNLESIAYPLANINTWIRNTFPNVGADFRVEAMVLDQIQSFVNIGTVSMVVTSVSSFIVDLAVGVFSVAFMSYFFISDEGLLTRTAVSIAPESMALKIKSASSRTTRLLSRYFTGLLIESLCIMILNGLGLSLIAGMQTGIAVMVAVMTGVMNIVPYIGPLAGELLAVMMGMVTQSTSSFTGSFGFFLIVVLAVCLITQMIDNYVFQPVIYSNSVKAHPLEIFIVLLMAGKLWGVVGMIIAIPGYTVLRVILSELFPDARIVKLLTMKMQK